MGNHTFGALLVHEGRVLVTAGNTVLTDNDRTRHAELNLLVQARRFLPDKIFPELTLYTSCAPCMTCSSFMADSGIAKVVFGVSYVEFAKLTGSRKKIMTCDQYYRETGKALDWIGPVLEAEGLKVFRHWPGDKWQGAILENLQKITGC